MLIAPPLSLYIHIPWCVKKCPYCDFNSHAQVDGIPQEAYVTALLADLDRDIADYGAALGGRALHSIFFGGGTPSLFSPDSIARILDGVKHRLDFNSGIEITLETNPGTVEHGRLDGYLAAGVNRISFGVQSFDDDKLRRLGRIHSASDAARVVGEARAAGFDNFNIDLMYALPGQDLAGAARDIEQAIALAPTHISHYQLTIEPNTAFASRPPTLPDSDAAWDMQEHSQHLLAEAGYSQYEISAYAKPDRRSQHNLNYWHFGDYLGIGAGAHGKLTDAATGSIRRRAKQRTPRAYLQHAGQSRGIASEATLANIDLPFEYMMNALRLVDGVPMGEFAQRTGLGPEAIADTLARARAQGWIDNDSAILRTTETGQRFLNDVIALFLPAGDGESGRRHA
ncbi:MAG: radical SAM family heme chaperone HemW [Dokdonella sp.]|uniref:radical SAM family heme chaperone HemW n=1 Tax=Dokdonella sp. TaxID=2291710 RepID=UPI002BC229AF|nr:radical SAM family heme chaperone HemW [Xanthomonadales bacterium]HQV73391.1 radical SAM family heme chaperone HemW [Dokdonella sp.]MBK7209955.1 radical SAM family heme chaperone HemW [Xanthomonadales bacterium]MBL0222612.1 radical SAM family heme chaperone HemW [Xanthomonadales bacterium]HQW77555.1 radical SAM family heme chaperone HemW [Dokdonella sp.]